MLTTSTVSSVATTIWGFAARLRALRAVGAQLNQKRSVVSVGLGASGSGAASTQAPHTGSAWGRPVASAVAIQKLRAAVSRSRAHDHGNTPSRSSGTP